MSAFLELDVVSLQNELRQNRILRGDDVLGPNEKWLGSTNHEFFRADTSLILHIQDFRFKGACSLRMFRKGFVSFQFTKAGSYYRSIRENTDPVSPATVHISNAPETTSYILPHDRRLYGIAVYAEREYLTDLLGLQVDKLREPYRSIFTSPLGSSSSLQIPLIPSIWSAVDDVLQCNLKEPLRAHYMQAKAIELICGVVAHINIAKAPHKARVSPEFRRQQQLAIAAEIYRREIHRPPSISSLASRIGLTRNQLLSGFAEQYGLTPQKYSIRQRMEFARSQLVNGGVPLAEVAINAGYSNYAAFSRAYSAYFGRSPSEDAAR